MNDNLIERCLAVACANLLRDNEGVVIIVDNTKYLVWVDVDAEGRVLRIRGVEEDESFFKDASMMGETETEIKSGLKVWVHPDTVQ